MRIEYSKSAVKAINGMDKATKKRILSGIEGLMKKPPDGDIKPLQGHSDGRQRLRIGKYRVVFRFSIDGQIEILHIMDIGSRGDIYK